MNLYDLHRQQDMLCLVTAIVASAAGGLCFYAMALEGDTSWIAAAVVILVWVGLALLKAINRIDGVIAVIEGSNRKSY